MALQNEKVRQDIPELDDDADAYQIREIKLNPDYLYFKALLELQRAAGMENVEKGVVLYRQSVEHMEMLARGFGRIPAGYDDKVKEFSSKEEFKSLEPRRRNFELSRYKAMLLVQKISDSMPMTDKLSI